MGDDLRIFWMSIRDVVPGFIACQACHDVKVGHECPRGTRCKCCLSCTAKCEAEPSGIWWEDWPDG